MESGARKTYAPPVKKDNPLIDRALALPFKVAGAFMGIDKDVIERKKKYGNSEVLYSVDSLYEPTDSDDTASHKFTFIDSHGNLCESGGIFYDGIGNPCEWGAPFHDGRGNLIEWGDPFYDGKGNYCDGKSPFYDWNGNLIDPRG